MPHVIRATFARLREFYPGLERTNPEDLVYIAKVSMWVRWFWFCLCLLEVQYRIEYGSLSHFLNSLYLLGFISCTGCVYYLVWRSGRVKQVWLLTLSGLELAGMSLSLSLSGGFNSPYFPMYYVAIALFAWVFASPRLALAWTTLAVVIYTALSVLVEPGLDFGAKDERSLFYRIGSMYTVTLSVSIMTGFLRDRRVKGLDRERELHRQRIELSQTIHDTTAQWAYMIRLGIEGAMELADGSQEALLAKLRLAADLTRSAMWELRHPIDGGQIFRGEELGEVLEAHAATFTVITSVLAELVQHGREPPLSTIAKSLLFSVAHNSLTNVIRHAGAQRVVIELDCRGEELRLSVSDDGVGLPPDYETRGHGFRNMRADAARMGGDLEVQSDGDGGGTTVACVVPYRTLTGGE